MIAREDERYHRAVSELDRMDEALRDLQKALTSLRAVLNTKEKADG